MHGQPETEVVPETATWLRRYETEGLPTPVLFAIIFGFSGLLHMAMIVVRIGRSKMRQEPMKNISADSGRHSLFNAQENCLSTEIIHPNIQEQN